MATEPIKHGTRYWPAGLEDLGGDAPDVLYVRGNPEHLASQAVVIDGTPETSPRGAHLTADMARGVARTDIVIAGEFENPLARSAVLAAAREGGGAVLFSRRPLNSIEDRELPYWVSEIEKHGGAVVSFSPDSGEPLSVDDYRRRIAAHSTVVWVTEATDDYLTTQIAETADKLGRAVAVSERESYEGRQYAGVRDLMQFNKAVQVSGSRGVIDLVGPPPVTPSEQLVAQLDHLEFSKRVGQLREMGYIDVEGERTIQDMAMESKDLREFQARMHYGGSRMLGATEYRYLMTALETPEGQRPQTWSESEAYVRAFGFDRYETVTQQAQMERDRAQQQSMAIHQ